MSFGRFFEDADDRVQLPPGKQCQGYPEYNSIYNQGWIEYIRRAFNFNEMPNHPLKVHVSIHPDDVERANPYIKDFLTKKGITEFKLVPFYLEAHTHRSNVHGKELTIYILNEGRSINPEERDPAFWIQLFRELEDLLREHNIRRNPIRGFCEQPFPGSSGSITFRNDVNCCNIYVMAQALAECGFTCTEANDLSSKPSPLLAWFGKHLPPASEEKIPFVPQVSRDVSHFSSKASKKLYLAQMTEQNAQSIFLGYVPGKKTVEANRENIPRMARFNKNQACNFIDILSAEIEELKPSEREWRRFLDECLEEAVRCFANAKQKLVQDRMLNGDTNFPIGNIMPAIYYEFFMPFMDKKKPLGSPAKIINREKFIERIVECSFRDVGQYYDQVTVNTPRYIGNLNAKDVSRAITQVQGGFLSRASSFIKKPFTAIKYKANDLQIRFKEFKEEYPGSWFFIKWIALPVAIAAVLWVSGGAAAIPVVGSWLTSIGVEGAIATMAAAILAGAALLKGAAEEVMRRIDRYRAKQQKEPQVSDVSEDQPRKSSSSTKSIIADAKMSTADLNRPNTPESDHDASIALRDTDARHSSAQTLAEPLLGKKEQLVRRRTR